MNAREYLEIREIAQTTIEENEKGTVDLTGFEKLKTGYFTRNGVGFCGWANPAGLTAVDSVEYYFFEKNLPILHCKVRYMSSEFVRYYVEWLDGTDSWMLSHYGITQYLSSPKEVIETGCFFGVTPIVTSEPTTSTAEMSYIAQWIGKVARYECYAKII